MLYLVLIRDCTAVCCAAASAKPWPLVPAIALQIRVAATTPIPLTGLTLPSPGLRCRRLLTIANWIILASPVALVRRRPAAGHPRTLRIIGHCRAAAVPVPFRSLWTV